jgi:hypothetical protein
VLSQFQINQSSDDSSFSQIAFQGLKSFSSWAFQPMRYMWMPSRILTSWLVYWVIAASSRNFSIPHHNARVLGEMAGNAMHCRAIAAALACVLKAGDCQCSNGGCLLLASAVACDLWLERLLPACWLQAYLLAASLLAASCKLPWLQVQQPFELIFFSQSHAACFRLLTFQSWQV